MPPLIYTLGGVTIDDIVHYDTGKAYFGTPGGNAVFSAIGAKVWGGQPHILARVGTDYPQEAIRRIREGGIVLHLIQVPYPAAHTWTLYEAGGLRQFVGHLTSCGPYEMAITGPEIPDQHLNGDGYHIASTFSDIQLTIVERLRTADRVFTLDPHTGDLNEAQNKAILKEMMPRLPFFLPSREQAEQVIGRDDPVEAARTFADWGAAVVVVKMGAHGSLVYLRDQQTMYHVPVYPARAIDTTGAGDSFCGGFLAGYLTSGDPVRAACYGTVSASFVVEHIGTLAMLDIDYSMAPTRLEHVWERVEAVRPLSSSLPDGFPGQG
ncbi:MAG: hypothetical protein IT326_02190 [Anaerolineae bacterium]|nr:hypothetical protein [Anaerolineae bacterium]